MMFQRKSVVWAVLARHTTNSLKFWKTVWYWLVFWLFQG